MKVWLLQKNEFADSLHRNGLVISSDRNSFLWTHRLNWNMHNNLDSGGVQWMYIKKDIGIGRSASHFYLRSWVVYIRTSLTLAKTPSVKGILSQLLISEKIILYNPCLITFLFCTNKPFYHYLKENLTRKQNYYCVSRSTSGITATDEKRYLWNKFSIFIA